MLVVAERLVLRFAAAAQRDARKSFYCSILSSHLDHTGDEERSIPHRGHLHAAMCLRLAAIEAAIKQGTARASLNDLCHGIGLTLVGQHPWPSLELEYTRVAAKAFCNVDAKVEVEADLDVAAPIYLAHARRLRRRWRRLHQIGCKAKLDIAFQPELW